MILKHTVFYKDTDDRTDNTVNRYPCRSFLVFTHRVNKFDRKTLGICDVNTDVQDKDCKSYSVPIMDKTEASKCI